MKQLLYLLPNSDHLKEFTETVNSAGIEKNHIHIAHKDHSTLQKQSLNDLNFIEEFDTIHAGIRGLLVGIILAATIGFSLLELLEGHPVASALTLFSCLIIVGFATWLGGLIGSSSDNYRLQPFHDHIQQGASVVIIDVDKKMSSIINQLVINSFPLATAVGTSSSIDNPFSGDFHLRKHY